jgi:serine protease Do
VLKIDGDKDFPTLPIGNSDDIRVGDWVVAIGNPYEFDHTVTVGVLSAKERAFSIPDSDGTRHYEALLQTDASINPGNSGGPLLNLAGEVIGINTAVNAQAQGIGFAIPTSTILSVLDSLKANEEVPIPYIGIQMTDVPEEYVDDLGLEDSKGAFIADVMFRSPAHEAGLQKYDVIVRIDGEDIQTSSDVQKIVRSKKPGDKLVVEVIRNGRPVSVTVIVGDRNEAQQQ